MHSAFHSAFHLLPQKFRHGGGQAVVQLRGDLAPLLQEHHHTAQDVALAEDGGRHAQVVTVGVVRGLELVAAGGVAVELPVLHELVQLRGIGLVHELPLLPAGLGDDAVPVADGGDTAGVPADGLAHLDGEVLQIPQGRIFAEGHAAVLLRVDLQGAPLLDAQGVADLLGDHHPAKAVCLCQARTNRFLLFLFPG